MTLLADTDVDNRLPAGWSRDGKHLVRTLTLPSFPDAVALIQRIAAVAEAHDHHPDIHLSWRTLTLRLTTHDAGGLTTRDLELAEALAAILAGAANA